MKKRISGIIALSMALALTFGMTVSAAESVDTGKADQVISGETITVDVPEITDEADKKTYENQADELKKKVEVSDKAKATDSTGAEVDVTVTAAPVEPKVARAASTAAEELVKKLVAENRIPVVENHEAKANVLAATDVTVDTTNIDASKGVVITFAVPGLVREPGKYYVVMHLRSDGVWETLDADVSNGTVTATFTSFSPVVIVEVAQQQVSNNSNNNSNNNSSTTPTAAPATTEAVPQSPQTGDVVPFAAVLAIVCVAGAAFSAKRIKFNK